MRAALVLPLVFVSLLSGEVLFDGKSFAHFRTPTGTTSPAVSWRIVDGALVSIGDADRQCDLWTTEEFEDFDLRFEWKLAPGANSGIKYLIQDSAVDDLKDRPHPFIHETSLGYEFQLLGTPATDQVITKQSTGALYNYLAPRELAAHAPGEWNTGRLVVRGEHVEHWVNGRMVLSYQLRSAELVAALREKQQRSSRLMEALQKRKSPIVFQHHESEAWFRNIRVERLAGE